MSKFLRRALAVLTIAALTRFATAPAAETAGACGAFRDNPAWAAADGAVSSSATTLQNALVSRATLADSVTSFEYRAPKGAHATLYLMGRYAIELPGNGDWQSAFIRLRAPRFDAGYNKKANALLLEARVGGDLRKNVIYTGASDGARWPAEDMRGPSFFVVDEGRFEVRNSRHDPADFAEVTLPAASGGETNEKSLIDIVARGKELFTS